jgi:hypothetical protein
MIITLVFEKKRQFFRLKLAKIAENCDHNIDPSSVVFNSKGSSLEMKLENIFP